MVNLNWTGNLSYVISPSRGFVLLSLSFLELRRSELLRELQRTRTNRLDSRSKSHSKWLPLLTTSDDVEKTFQGMQEQGVKVVRTWVLNVSALLRLYELTVVI